MKSNFESDPHHASELPVEYEADALTSNSPAAIPTVAPDALIAPTRAELNARWLAVFPSFAAIRTWHEMFGDLAPRLVAPELN